MTENTEVEVAYGDNPQETAQNLLAAAERLGLEPFVVRTTSKGYFIVPPEVAKNAGNYSEGVDDESGSDDKALADLTNKELEDLAKAEDITLESADKKNKDARVAKIESVRAERAAADAESEDGDDDGETQEGEPDTGESDDENKE